MPPKSAGIKKTGPLIPHTTNHDTSENSADDIPDTPITIWPEWSDVEVSAEKWSTKHAFEDPDGLVWLPRSLRKLVDSVKRPNEMVGEGQTPVVVQPMISLDEMFNSPCSLLTSPFSTSAPFMNTTNTSRVGGCDLLNPISVLPLGSAHESTAQTVLYSQKQQTQGSNWPEPDDSHAVLSTDLTSLDEPADAAQMHSISVGDSLPSQEIPGYAITHAGISPEDISKQTDPLQTTPNNRKDANGMDGTSLLESVAPVQENSDSLVGTSKFFQTNKHLVGSELMRSVLASMHFLYEQHKLYKPIALAASTMSSNMPTSIAGNTSVTVSGLTGVEDFTPWDAIYPKSKDGIPMYNPSGKYIVKLFWLGAWRKITVDDRIPIDASGKPLMISSPATTEIWPLLICKALVKAANTSFKECEGMNEAGDFDVLHCLRGWIPEKLPIRPKTLTNLSSVLFSIANNRLPQLRFDSNTSNASPLCLVTPCQNSLLENRELSGLNTGFKSGNSTDRQTPTSASPVRQNLSQPSISFLFATKASDDGDPCDVKTLSYPHRICEIRENSDLFINNSTSQNTYAFKIRCYFTSGLKRLTSPKDKVEETDYTDFWLSQQEFAQNFTNVAIYHPSGSFKISKSISQITDVTKSADTYRISSVLSSSEETKEVTTLISFSSLGRIRRNTTICIPSVSVEEYSWNSTVFKPTILRISTNSCASSLLRILPNRAYKFTIDCPTPYALNIYSRDDFNLDDEGKYLVEKQGLKIREVEDTLPAQQPASWSILFKLVVMVNEPTLMGMHLYVPEFMQAATCVHVVNNDTGKEVPQLLYTDFPQVYQPTKNGYTIVADTRTSTTPRPPTKWKARLISDSIPQTLSEKELIFTKPLVQDIEESYSHNKRYTLFRYVLKVKDAQINNAAFQVTFSLSGIWIKLQLFDNDVEIFSTKGKGSAICYSALLYHSEDVVVKSSDKTKDDKRSVAAAAAAAQQSSVPKHKYILQASIVATDAEMLILTAALSGAENIRPNSRGTKSTSSAKKKKATMSAGGAPIQPIAISNLGAGAGTAAGGGTTTSTNVSNATTGAGTAITVGAATMAGIPTSATTGSGQTVANETDLIWHLRIISTDTATVVAIKDTEREDRQKALKDSWEAASPGRMARARELRDTYIRMVENGLVRPALIEIGNMNLCKPWTVLKTMSPKVQIMTEQQKDSEERIKKQILAKAGNRQSGPRFNAMTSMSTLPSAIEPSEPKDCGLSVINFRSIVELADDSAPPQVLSPQVFEQKAQERRLLIAEHGATHAAIKLARAEKKEKRAWHKKLLIDIVEEKLREVEHWNKIDAARRDMYRQRILKEADEYHAKQKSMQEAAMKAAELAAEQVANEESSEKKKKSKK
ncbi:hypothetical protein BDV3_004205 [Batrachochytrium dendrobatidis]